MLTYISYFLFCLEDSNWGGDKGPKGAEDIGVGVGEIPTRCNVESLFGPCKPPQLLLADQIQSKAFFGQDQ